MSRSALSRRTAIGVLALGIAAALLVLAGRDSRAGDRGDDPLRVPVTQSIGVQLLASGLGGMTYIANAGDARLFLVLQSGQIRIYTGGSLLPTPFLDVSGIITSGGERGLLSVAFHPQYASNGFFFVYYTNVFGDIEIARLKVSTGDANQADPASRVVLLTIDHHSPPNPNANHNGGQLQFGPDGYLYIGTGDGGSSNDPPCNAQNDGVLLGKILRINVDQNVNSSPFYGIPASNPFIGAGLPLDEIWAKGVRNPWRFSFDRATGDLWIGDVGQSAWEEIDFQPQASAGGENYGWKIMEGNHCGVGGTSNCTASPTPPPCTSPPSPLYTPPVFEYDHGGGRCSVTGGYVYRGSQDPTLLGTYIYGDYCSGQIWGNGQLLAPVVPSLTTFGEDNAGELYLGTGGGQFYRIIHVAATPTPTLTPVLSATRTPTLSATATITPTPTGPPTLTPTPFRPGIPVVGHHRPRTVPLTPRPPA